MMFTKAIPLYRYTVTASRLPHCTISIHVRLYAQLTDKIVLNFVRGRSIAEKQAVNLVVIYIFSCLKSILRMGFYYDMIDACFFINRKFHLHKKAEFKQRPFVAALDVIIKLM